MKRTLYLHPGWSKTGTSALQRVLHAGRNGLLELGILYPLTFQWKDHAHHDFALAFAPASRGPYRTALSPKKAIDALEAERKETGASSAIISSELSPIYFNNPRFAQFAQTCFDEVQLLFTLRWQSELLLSLFSQLVSDPNVRYSQSLFYLFVQNVNWLNFHAHIRQWEQFVDRRNIFLFNHSEAMIGYFTAHLGLPPQTAAMSASRVNSSVPARSLLAIQSACNGLDNATEYAKKRDEILAMVESIDPSNDRLPLFRATEQTAIDKFYLPGNNGLVERYRFIGPHLEDPRRRVDVLCASWQDPKGSDAQTQTNHVQDEPISVPIP